MEPTDKNASGSSAPPSAPSAGDPHLEGRIKNGASWFYWIAAFSVINSILVYTSLPWTFGLGLGATVERDNAARQMGGSAMISHLGINIAIAGLVAAFGYFAGKRHGWAFLVGMILLGLDTVLTGLLSMWLNLALHLWAMISIFLGYRACRAAGR